MDVSLTQGRAVDTLHAVTKIVLPSRRQSILHRPRLVNFLHEHIERKLLLVSASAGYGKTSLLIDFAYDTTLPVCWYSLDASDSDPKIFLDYIIASLRRRFPDFGARTRALLATASAARDLDVIVGTLVTEIFEQIPSYFVLILDDFHTVEESDAINRVLDTLLRLLPENAHIILASRTLPSRLTLTRLTARQEIAGLGVNDLRFSADEIRALVQQNYHIELSESQAAELAQHSEGWITGILLTTHTLWKGLLQDLVRLHGPQGSVFRYLANEVFALQPPDLQRFLLDTSLLDQLEPRTCDAILGISNSAEMLNSIEQKNLFVTRLEEGEAWYRYHHLFQDFLQTRLTETDPARWRNLNQRAAKLFESQESWGQAISHYSKAELFDDTARTIEHIARETFDAGHWTTLTKWIDTLPSETLDAHPDLLIWRAKVADETGELKQSKVLYQRALAIFEHHKDKRNIGRTLINQAVSFRMQGLYRQAIDNCQRALALIGEDDKAENAHAHRIIGISYGLLGNWKKCISALKTALDVYDSLDDFAHVGGLLHDLGVAYRTTGNGVDAEKHFRHALEYWHRANNIRGLANTLNSIGVGYHRQGNFTRAIETLEQAHDQAKRCGHLYYESIALASLGDVYRDIDDYGRARTAYQAAFEIAHRIDAGFLITFTLNALGETLRLEGELGEASRLLDQALAQAQSHRSDYEIGLTQTALGILNFDQGNIDTATQYLTQAIELLEQGGAKRESARAHLHLARLSLAKRKFRQVGQHLKIVANLGSHLHDDQFVLAEGKQLLPVIKYAVTKKIGDGYFARALEKIKERPSLSPARTPDKSVTVVAPQVQACAFGTATVMVDGKEITKAEWDSAATKELFFLVLAHPQGLRKEQILGALWATTSLAKANAIFHSTAYRMRRALFPNCLVYANGLYRLNDKLDLLDDVSEFVRLINQAKSAGAEDCIALYRDAEALYRGDYFEDCYSDWCIPIRDDLKEKYLTALEGLADCHLKHGDNEQAQSLYLKILEQDCYREDVYQALMTLQLRAGDRAGVVRTYQRSVDALKELNLEPSSETRALYEQARLANT